MKDNIIIKAFLTTAFVMLICVSFSFAQSSAKKPAKFVKKNNVVKSNTQKKQQVVVLQGQVNGTAQNNNTLTAAQQAQKAQTEYTPTNHNYSHTRAEQASELLQSAIQQKRADNQQQRLGNVPLDGSSISTNFRTLINP